VVSIKEEATGNIYELTKVEGGNHKLARDLGIFAHDPNYLYKTEVGEFIPTEGLDYTLQIQRNNIDTLVTATVKMVDAPRIVRPSMTGNAAIHFDYTQRTKFIWKGGENTGLYDLSFIVHYRERDEVNGGGFTNRFFVWDVVNNFENEEYELDGINFYGMMVSKIEENPNMVRRFEHIDMIVSAGGPEIEEYVRIGQANSGLTSSQDIPVFSNMSEGRGLFSTKQQSRNIDLPISLETLDSLANGQITKSLNFTN